MTWLYNFGAALVNVVVVEPVKAVWRSLRRRG